MLHDKMRGTQSPTSINRKAFAQSMSAIMYAISTDSHVNTCSEEIIHDTSAVFRFPMHIIAIRIAPPYRTRHSNCAVIGRADCESRARIVRLAVLFVDIVLLYTHCDRFIIDFHSFPNTNKYETMVRHFITKPCRSSNVSHKSAYFRAHLFTMYTITVEQIISIS